MPETRPDLLDKLAATIAEERRRSRGAVIFWNSSSITFLSVSTILLVASKLSDDISLALYAGPIWATSIAYGIAAHAIVENLHQKRRR